MELGPAQRCTAKAVECSRSLVPVLVLMVSDIDKRQAAVLLGWD